MTSTSTQSPLNGHTPEGAGAHEMRGDALAALAGGTAEPAARFRYDVVGDSWWWSPGMYALHGLDPDEVVPSTGLLLAHKHADDRARTEGTLRAVLATGEPFCCRHRIVDAAGRVRTVMSVGEGRRDEAGAVVAVDGYFVDLTDALHEFAAREAREAVARSAESRAVIEQAKGMLIAVYHLDADAAFELLCWSSQQTNITVRALAHGLVCEFTQTRPGDLSAAVRAGAYLRLLPGAV